MFETKEAAEAVRASFPGSWNIQFALDILSFTMLIGHVQMQLNGGLWLGSFFSCWIKRWTLRILLQAVPCGAAQLIAFRGVFLT